MWPVAVSVHFSIRCMASDAGYAVQCLSPEYNSMWFQLVFFSTVSCFWVVRKIRRRRRRRRHHHHHYHHYYW